VGRGWHRWILRRPSDPCFAIALWNGEDPILKERLFGLTNAEGNHGEDVKEYYFYLDATPTSSYLKYRYRHPLKPYSYDDLIATNRGRSRYEFEYELIDTGVFDADRYVDVDVDVEYAKSAPEDNPYPRNADQSQCRSDNGPSAAPLRARPSTTCCETTATAYVRRCCSSAGLTGMGAGLVLTPAPPSSFDVRQLPWRGPQQGSWCSKRW
jgi:hypothetical protein